MRRAQAAERWEHALARWAWPQELLDATDGDPWSLAPEDLAGHRERESDHDSPADVAAREALPRNGTVLDVGCGTGASSAPLRRAARLITGVDTRAAMLEAFTEATTADPGLLRRITGGVPDVRTVQGAWPAVADQVELADVVLAHNVLYDVTHDADAFVAALTDHARRTVVLALTARHPLHWTNPYAELVHGIRRPAEPTAAVAADLVTQVTGSAPTVLEWTEQLTLPDDRDAFARVVARRCCVPAARIGEVHAALHRVPADDPADGRAGVAGHRRLRPNDRGRSPTAVARRWRPVTEPRPS